MIRQAIAKDLDAIVKLEMDTFDDAYTSQTIQNDINSNKLKVLVADNKIIGYITIGKVLDEAEIERIAIIKELRKMGYATNLLNETINELIGSGIKKVYLEVRSDNLAAIKLYLKCGFQNISTRKKYYKDGCDAIVMANYLEVQ